MEIFGVIAGVAAFFYMAFIGQKTLKEWWRDRNHNASQAAFHDSGKPPATIYHNLPQPEYGQAAGKGRANMGEQVIAASVAMN